MVKCEHLVQIVSISFYNLEHLQVTSLQYLKLGIAKSLSKSSHMPKLQFNSLTSSSRLVSVDCRIGILAEYLDVERYYEIESGITTLLA
jgi:hypothetical protein